jgi:hypothetical protein
MTNKNNNLNDDVNMSKHNSRHRKHNNNKKDFSNNNTNRIDDILDYIGAKNGITFLANGSSNGANKVSPDVFEDILKKMLASDSPNNKKEGETSTDIGSIPSQDYSYSLTHTRLNPFESTSTDDIFEDDDEEDYFEDGLENIFDELLGDNIEDEENCPMGSLFKVMMQAKPFGIEWEKDKVVDFLKQNGYEIHQKTSKIDGSEFTLAYKAGVTKPIDEINITNLSKEFSRTIQDILLKWLLRIK